MVSRKLTKHFLLLFLLLSLFLTSCRLGRATPTPIAITLPGQLTDMTTPTAQESYTVQRGEVVQEEIFTGRVTPVREENLFFRRSGQITEVYVNDGDQVQTGDVIAVLDNEVLEIDLESALIGLSIAQENQKRAEAELAYRREQAEINVEIAQALFEDETTTINLPSSTPKSSVQQVRTAQLAAAQLALEQISDTIDPTVELNVKRAELAVERVKQAILEGQIEASFAGEVRFINMPKEGEKVAVQAYNAVARLVEAKSYQIELNLPSTQLELLQEGMAVAVSAASLGPETLPAVIKALPRPFGTSQGSLAEVTLVNAADNKKLSEGITVVVNVRLKSKPDALVIPRLALQEEDQIYSVTVKDGESLRHVTVGVGVLGSDLVEITAGLTAGQTIVVN